MLIAKYFTRQGEIAFAAIASKYVIRNSWFNHRALKKANFYSCDGKQGYLILKTSKMNYIFKSVPINVWSNFKEASSFGKFYNKNIRGKYKLTY